MWKSRLTALTLALLLVAALAAPSLASETTTASIPSGGGLFGQFVIAFGQKEADRLTATREGIEEGIARLLQMGAIKPQIGPVEGKAQSAPQTPAGPSALDLFLQDLKDQGFEVYSYDDLKDKKDSENVSSPGQYVLVVDGRCYSSGYVHLTGLQEMTKDDVHKAFDRIIKSGIGEELFP